MATLNMSDQMTALEICKRANQPDPYHIIELMRLVNEMLIDAPAYEANNGTVNVTLQRNIKAMGEHRIYNKGVGRVATQTEIIHDRIAVLEEYALVDELMLEHSGNINAARQSEAVAIIKGMGLTQAATLIYGDEKKPDEFAGLMSRRNSLTLPDGSPNPNVIDAGGTGFDLTSMYLCAFGQDLFHLIYPKGSNSVGVSRHDKGMHTVVDGNGKEYEAYRDHYRAQYGISIRFPGAVKRICNIPASITGDDLVDIMLDTRRRMPVGASTYASYSNVDLLIKLDKAARDKVNVTHTAADPWGKEITHVRDIRCRQMDVILNTEDQVA
jgi:hypothetical protein